MVFSFDVNGVSSCSQYGFYLNGVSSCSQDGLQFPVTGTWVHVDGRTSPHFDVQGYVIGLDKEGTFLADFRRYLDDARAKNILVFATLWNLSLIHI